MLIQRPFGRYSLSLQHLARAEEACITTKKNHDRKRTYEQHRSHPGGTRPGWRGLPYYTVVTPTRQLQNHDRHGSSRRGTPVPDVWQTLFPASRHLHRHRYGEVRKIRHEGNTRQPWEWNLRLLFNEAMGPVAEMAPEGLRDKVMKIAGIQQKKYYDKVLTLATEKRIVKTTIAKNGRVVVIPIPS